MEWPSFNQQGDLPPGVHRAHLSQVLDHFGQGSLRRQIMGRRLERIYRLAAATGHLARFVVYGSFVTTKANPGDVDVFMLMAPGFDLDRLSRDEGAIFHHMVAHDYEGASIFWSCRSSLLGSEEELIEHWQLKRDGTKRGIVEVIDHD